MKPALSFGIGCFNFSFCVEGKSPAAITGKQYIEAVRNALESVKSISNIDIDASDDFLKESFTIDPKDKLHFGPGGAAPVLLDIKFEVFIPFRIQASIEECGEKDLDTHTEKFRVEIRSSFYSSFAVIVPLSPLKEPDPSDAVRIVRCFFENEFSRGPKGSIAFESLGPTPFHADCYLAPFAPGANINQIPFAPIITARMGFDRVDISFDSARFRSPDSCLDELLYTCQFELSMFYLRVFLRNDLMERWAKISAILKEMTAQRDRTGFLTSAIRVFSDFRHSAEINRAVILLAEFETTRMESKDTIRNAYQEVYADNPQPIFKKFVDRELEEEYTYPTQELAHLLEFFERRIGSRAQMLTNFASAILGGIAGSLLTIKLSQP